jgi:SAM-dependent methyltransferase
VGCGRGELLKLLASDFGRAAGCDPSAEMLASLGGSLVETRLQPEPATLPFESKSFDFVTAVCVYHPVPLKGRAALTREIARVIRPGGVFCMIEHNPSALARSNPGLLAKSDPQLAPTCPGSRG